MDIELLIPFLFGLIFGSFGNVCIHRFPLDESVSRGRSHCPHCGALIQWFDNIPILSWLFLLMRCRACRGSISWRYPVTELVTGVAFAAAFHFFEGYQAVAAALLLWSFIVVFWIDMLYRIIPNEITFPLIGLGIVFCWIPRLGMQNEVLPYNLLAFASGPAWLSSSPARSLLGIAVGGGALLFVRVLGNVIYKQEAMGLGDVKFTAMVGAWLGPSGAFLTIAYGVVGGGVLSAFLLLFRLAGRKSYIPFGPFLVLGAVIALFAPPFARFPEFVFR